MNRLLAHRLPGLLLLAVLVLLPVRATLAVETEPHLNAIANGSQSASTLPQAHMPLITGVKREVSVTDFPRPGQTALLVWQESQQSFVVKSVTGSPVTINRDIIHTRLAVDLATLTATATMELAAVPYADVPATFEAGGLEIRQVSSGGQPVPWHKEGDRLVAELSVPAHQPVSVSVDYGFTLRTGLQGLASTGSTLTWPYYCGNLFPCHSSPADGSSYELSVVGAPAGQTTVYAPYIAAGPAYQLAWATGPYQRFDLGTTPQGTRLAVYALEGREASALTGTADLVQVMAWYENTYGSYPFGKEAGAVAVDWQDGYGGMEHHPYWHVDISEMNDPLVHAHEAAHAWSGNAVRMACWEDFALSEGTASYIAARAMAEVKGPAEAQRIWDGYDQRLKKAMAGAGPKIAWPDGCGKIDVLVDGLYSDIAYMKGAFFWRALAQKLGEEAVDAVLKTFFHQYRYRPASYREVAGTVAEVTGYDAAPCLRDWLQREMVPEQTACP